MERKESWERKKKRKEDFPDFSARKNVDVIRRDGIFVLFSFRTVVGRDGGIIIIKKKKRPERRFGDAGSSRAPCRPVRAELRVAARRRGLATQVSRAAHPVGERTAALQRPVR